MAAALGVGLGPKWRVATAHRPPFVFVTPPDQTLAFGNAR